MKVRLGLCCLLAVVLAIPVSAQQKPVQSDQQIIISLERQWNDAFYQKDMETVDKMLAQEFMATYEDGSRGDRDRELTLTKEFDQRIESAVQDDFTVKVYGDTAVVWFTLHLVGIRRGAPAEVILSFTDIWVMRDGRWQCVSTHSTKVTAS